MSARRAALEVVTRVFEGGAYADRAFRSVAERLDARDRAFAMELAYGTVRQRRLLDHAIVEIGGRSVDQLDPPVRAALRLGAYQLAFMASVPDHAAVNETVELVRTAGLARATGFANGVMRRLSEQVAQLLSGLDDRTAAAAALRHSYPDWIATTWFDELGPEAARQLMVAQNQPAELVVRVNRRAASAPAGVEPLDGEPDTLLADALTVTRIPDAWLEYGLVWPQSRGSQLAGSCVPSARGERVLDLCAAPGGKATQLRGEVVAVELDARRARELEETVTRQRATNVQVFNADARSLPRELGGFDPRSGRRSLLRPWRPGVASRSALACEASTRAAGRVARGGTRARPCRRKRHLLGLHDEPLRDRGGDRQRARLPRRSRSELPHVSPRPAPGVPDDAAPPTRHRRLLHRAASAERVSGPPQACTFV